MFCRARSAAMLAFVRFSSSTERPALFAAARAATSWIVCASARLASTRAACRILNSFAGIEILLQGRVELGASRVRLRVEQRDLVLRRCRFGVGAALDDLLLRLEHFRLRLFERVLLIGRIELEDDVAFR